MREIKVTMVGVYDVVQRVQLTDEQWEDSVDPETGKLYNIDLLSEEAFQQSDYTSQVCAQCSGWGRKFTRTLSDETEIVTVESASGKVIYDRDAQK